jgi:hypothetical protein
MFITNFTISKSQKKKKTQLGAVPGKARQGKGLRNRRYHQPPFSKIHLHKHGICGMGLKIFDFNLKIEDEFQKINFLKDS